MSSDARELYRLEQLDRAITRKTAAIRTGHYRSAVDDEMDARSRAVLERDDQVARDATRLMLLFLRQLFNEHPDLRWKGDSGQTAADSDIIIESVYAVVPDGTDLSKPSITVRPGPRSSESVALGDIKHHDVFQSGSKTLTYIDVGTMQVLVHAENGAMAQDLVEFIHKALRMPDHPLLVRGFLKIDNVTSAGYDRPNPTYNQQVQKVTHVVLPITLTYYWQSTMRSEIAPGRFESPLTAGVLLRPRVSPTEPPLVDGQRDSVIESEGTLHLLPLNPDEE